MPLIYFFDKILKNLHFFLGEKVKEAVRKVLWIAFF